MKLSKVSTSQHETKEILEVLLIGYKIVLSDELKVVLLCIGCKYSNFY